MSKEGRDVAAQYAETLPRFSSREEARRALFAMRDDSLARLRAAADRSGDFRCDSSPESLKALEPWYFSMLESDGFGAVGLTRESLEQAISFYLGHVFATASGFEWIVEEYAFAPGHYEIGVRRELLTMMLTKPRALASRPDNKRRESLWREYTKYSS